MYKILVVDDEPTGLSHVCMILEKKCPQYEIIQTAQNGEQALAFIRKEQPDILITDIRMPIMDGITLVSKVKEEYPEILSVIVSGYSEFDYAKSALRSGVCDYLLKPLVPSDMANLMAGMEVKLNSMYYEKRNRILKALCNKERIEDEVGLNKYFPSKYYYAVIFRWNGLPSRFVKKHGVEIFSMEEEKIYIYGRDEMEALYLIPQELLFQHEFPQFAEKLFWREQNLERGAYVTGILCGDGIHMNQLSEIAQKLYRKLDESIVIGKSQLIQLNVEISVPKVSNEEKDLLENIEYAIKYKEYGKPLVDMSAIFAIWKKEGRSQIYMESTIKYILRLMQNVSPVAIKPAEVEFMLDDAFYYAADIEELENSIILLMRQYIPDIRKEIIDNKEQLFVSILSYLNTHIKDALTLGKICREFGVSQTSLSRMFRSYKETSFSNYLTEMRIEKAKKMMQQNPDAYIRDIAEHCGYSDQFYFSRIFSSVTGICPKEYMERMK